MQRIYLVTCALELPTCLSLPGLLSCLCKKSGKRLLDECKVHHQRLSSAVRGTQWNECDVEQKRKKTELVRKVKDARSVAIDSTQDCDNGSELTIKLSQKTPKLKCPSLYSVEKNVFFYLLILILFLLDTVGPAIMVM